MESSIATRRNRTAHGRKAGVPFAAFPSKRRRIHALFQDPQAQDLKRKTLKLKALKPKAPRPKTLGPKAFRTATLAALLVTVPFAGAYAASTSVYGPRETGLINQIESLDTGIRAATQANVIQPDEARDLHTQVVQLDQAAHRAARNGMMPATQYRQLLQQLDDVSQKLRVTTGSTFLIGSGGDGGHPNGYGPNHPHR